MKLLAYMVVILATLLLIEAAKADVRLTMGGGVYHIARDRDQYNEANYFWGASYGPVFGATFVNSHGDRSNTGGIVLRSDDRAGIEGSFYVGGVTGYDEPDWLQCAGVDLCLFVAPSVSWWVRDDVALTGVLFGDAAMYGITVKW